MTRLALLLLSVTSLAGAAETGTRLQALGAALDLSVVQTSAIADAHHNLVQDSAPLLAELRAVQRRLRAEQRSDAPSAATSALLQGQAADLRQRLDLLHVRTGAIARSVLTPEQQQALQALSLDPRPASDAARETAALAVRYSLLDAPAAPQSYGGVRANQGDFLSDGSRR